MGLVGSSYEIIAGWQKKVPRLEQPIRWRVESLSAGPGWRLLPEFHHDCRNQHSSPLREPGLRPLRPGFSYPGFSYNDRVTKGDPTDGDYDPIARYEQGVMILLILFAAAFLGLIVWLGWMIF
jgi:hypothetical protein